MYATYLNDRKSLNYPALKDITCGMKLVFITDSIESKSQAMISFVFLSTLLNFATVNPPAQAKDFLPGAGGFTPPSGMSRPNPNSPASNKHFTSNPASGASGQNPAGGGGGGNQNPSSGSDANSYQECELEKKVEEKFDESNAVKKLVKTALKSEDVENEYGRIKKRLEEGIDPVDIGMRSTPVSSNKVLIKADKGRYLVEISGDQIKVLGMCNRDNQKNVNSFKTLMNEMYDLNLKY